MKIVENVLNNNSDLMEFSIPVHSKEWYRFRTTGIEGMYDGGFGASEIGTILGLSDYSPVLSELMQYKDGAMEPKQRVTEASLSGILAESSILDRWQYWDGTELGYLQHWQNRAIQRRFRTLGTYIVNKNWPWLFCSLDAVIEKGQYSMGGDKLDRDSPIECKKVSYFVTKKWESKIPPSHIAQVQMQMLVTDTEWAELAVLMEGPSGPQFQVHVVKRHQGFCDTIISKTEELWHRVLELRRKRKEIALSEEKNPSQVERLISEYDSLLPLPDSNEAYKDYYAERYLQEKVKSEGDFDDFRHARKSQVYADAIKKLQKQQQFHENHILRKFVETGSEYLEFEGNGSVRYYTQKGKTKPQLDFRGLNIVLPEIKIEL